MPEEDALPSDHHRFLTPSEEAVFPQVDRVHSNLTHALLQEKEILQQQVDTQTQFIHLLVHQLATLGEESLSAEQRREFLDLVQQQVQHLQNLLQSLVAIQDLEAGILETRPMSFCLQDLAEEVTSHFHHPFVTYEFRTDLPYVWGDRWQISQILINLLSNAIKYSPANRPVEIGADLHSEGWVQVWVRDRGLGIPIESQAHLFERFYRVRHHDRANISGTGLGLSLCKLLVENQGGQIGFESVHGQGSRFYFTLPIAP
jgi:signal transduction histidine kinase